MSFDVLITDDDVFENDEHIDFSIDSLSLPKDVTTSNFAQARLIIEDNDGELLPVRHVLKLLFFMLA